MQSGLARSWLSLVLVSVERRRSRVDPLFFLSRLLAVLFFQGMHHSSPGRRQRALLGKPGEGLRRRELPSV